MLSWILIYDLEIEMNQNTMNAIFYSGLLALQFGLQPILSNRFLFFFSFSFLFNSSSLFRFHPMLNKSLVVILTEIFKIFIAILLIFLCYTKIERQNILKDWNLFESFQAAGLPAILYAIQNVLIQYGYLYLNSLTFNLLNQTKVRKFIIIAIFRLVIIIISNLFLL